MIKDSYICNESDAIIENVIADWEESKEDK